MQGSSRQASATSVHGTAERRMLGESSIIAELKPTARSSVTNGKRRFLCKVDGRSAQARRQRDLEQAFARDLGGNLTTAERLRCAQAAALSVRAETMQAAIARGDTDVNSDDLVRVANALSRELAALEALAAKRRAKPKCSLLGEYLANKAASGVAA